MTTRQYIRWLWTNMREIRSRVVLSCLAGILDVCAGLFFVWVSKQLIDIATRSAEGGMAFYTALLITTVCLEIILTAWKNRLESLTDIRLKNKLRYDLFSQLMLSSWTGKDRFHSGDTVNRLEEDVRVVGEGICKSLPAIVVTGFQFTAAFAFMSMLNARLTWVIIFIMPVFLLLSKVYIKHMRRLTKEVRNTDSRVQEHIQEKLQHRTLIQSLEQNMPVARKLGFLQSGLYAQVMSRTNFTVYSRALVMAGFAAGYIIAFLWGVNGIYRGVVSFGMMTAFLQLVGQVQRPIVEMGRHLPLLANTLASAERLMELDNLPPEKQGEQVILDGQTGIRLQNVSFAYHDGDRQIISDFSFDFTPGSRTAITGETGAGKSTLIRLMLALLHPRQGEIHVYNLQQEEKVSPLTRCNLVYVPQGNTLLSGTIRENLLLGNPGATEEQIKNALHTAAAEFVYDLSDGPDTICGERGAGLSEGQAQRICIARGLLRPGNILLLDELSSSLDGKTERLLMERLISNTKHKTLVFITHREMVADYCEQVVKLHRNTIP